MVVVLQRRVPPVAGVLIVLTLVVSLIAALDAGRGGALYGWLALVPDEVWSGELWRLATWILVQLGPVSLIFASVALFWFGGDLEWAWGSPLFARIVAAIVIGSAAVTSLLAFVLPGAGDFAYLGGGTLTSALVIAWAMRFPDRCVRVYHVLVLDGSNLAYGMVLVSVLFAMYFGLVAMLPELVAGGATLYFATGTHRRLRKLLRRLRARRVGAVRGGRHGGPYDLN